MSEQQQRKFNLIMEILPTFLSKLICIYIGQEATGYSTDYADGKFILKILSGVDINRQTFKEVSFEVNLFEYNMSQSSVSSIANIILMKVKSNLYTESAGVELPLRLPEIQL